MDDSEYSLDDALGGFAVQDVGSGVLFFTEVTLIHMCMCFASCVIKITFQISIVYDIYGAPEMGHVISAEKCKPTLTSLLISK